MADLAGNCPTAKSLAAYVKGVFAGSWHRLQSVNPLRRPQTEVCATIAGPKRRQVGALHSHASAGNDSETRSGRFRPPIHLRTESTRTITAAVMISTVSEVLM